MRVGVNATFLGEKSTGVGVYARKVSQAMAALHSDTSVFSPVPIEGIPVEKTVRVPAVLQGSAKFGNNLQRFLYLTCILPMRCVMRGIDVLYCPITEFPFVPGSAQVSHIHDLHPLLFPEQFGLASARFRLSLRFLRRSVRRVVVSSEHVKGQLLQLSVIPDERIDVVPLACDTGLFRPEPAGRREALIEKYGLKGPYILFVGSLFPYKNLETLVRAFLSAKARLAQSLVVVGRRELSPGPLAEDERIFYLDYVPSADLPLIYSFADLFVHPSKSEGFGLAPLEAMACGTPVIASRAASLPEVVGDAGILFDPADDEDLARLLVRVLGDNTLRNELRERGFRQVRKFTWEKTARGILDSCEKALVKTT